MNTIEEWKKDFKEFVNCLSMPRDDYKGIMEYIDEVPTVIERPQGEWTPVSKCWPAFSGLYLVSIDDLITVANFTGAYFINKKGLMLNVSAWQLLPEPYKEGSVNE